MNQNQFLLLVLLFVSPATYADKGQGKGYLTFGAFNGGNNGYSGLDISYLTTLDNYTGLKFSGVIYSKLNELNHYDLFSGGSLTGFVHANLPINPYIGLGIYAGDTTPLCNSNDIKYGSCRENKELSLFHEIGMAIEIEKLRLQITPFVRHYVSSNKPAYGVSIGIPLY